MEIKDMIQNNLPYLIVAAIIFILITLGGMFVVDMLHGAINDNNIRTENVVIIDKYHDKNQNGDLFLVKTDDNRTYNIMNDKDNNGQRLFNNIQTGKPYELVIREPDLTDFSPYPHVIQVHNDTM